MKFFLKNIFFVFCCFTFFSCGKETVSRTEFLIGTFCTIKIPKSKSADFILDECFEKIKTLEYIFSANDFNSELSKLNEVAFKKPTEVSNELLDLIILAKKIAEKTDGAFEPAIGNLVKLWGIGFENENLPSEVKIKKAIEDLSYKNILIDGNKISFTNENIKIDLGAIAKGHITDLIVKLLKEKKVESASINLGGNIYVLGKKFFTDDNWRIGLRKPYEDLNSYELVLSVNNTSVVTSGIYERYFEKDGTKYHHILDSKTGYPVRNNLVSVSVVCESSAYADALATAFLVMGYEKSIHFIKNFSEKKIDAVFIFSDNSYKTTNKSLLVK